MIDFITDYKHHCYQHRNDRDESGRHLHPIWMRWWWWLDWKAESGIISIVLISCFVYVFGFSFLVLALILLAIHSGVITPDEAWELLLIKER